MGLVELGHPLVDLIAFRIHIHTRILTQECLYLSPKD